MVMSFAQMALPITFLPKPVTLNKVLVKHLIKEHLSSTDITLCIKDIPALRCMSQVLIPKSFHFSSTITKRGVTIWSSIQWDL